MQPLFLYLVAYLPLPNGEVLNLSNEMLMADLGRTITGTSLAEPLDRHAVSID
jgi:hypothetical protein